VRSQEVAGGDVAHAEVLGERSSLRALSPDPGAPKRMIRIRRRRAVVDSDGAKGRGREHGEVVVCRKRVTMKCVRPRFFSSRLSSRTSGLYRLEVSRGACSSSPLPLPMPVARNLPFGSGPRGEERDQIQ